jgi:hypothetical protein
VASLSLQGFNLPKKLCREPHFAPKSLISRIAAQAQVHVARSCLKGSPKNAQLFLVDFEQHRRASTLLTVSLVKRLTSVPILL